MRADRLAVVKQAPMPLRELFAASAEQLLATDHARGLQFYAQCHALQRWLLLPTNPYRERFLAWEDECRGAMPGVQSTAKYGNAAAAGAAFDKEFAKDLPAMEKAFFEWFAAQ